MIKKKTHRFQVFSLPSVSFYCEIQCSTLWKNEWQVTGCRVLNSLDAQFHFFLFHPCSEKPSAFFLLLRRWGRPDQSVWEQQSFIAPHFLFTHFSQMISCICFPQTVSFLAAVLSSLSSHKVRSYKSCWRFEYTASCLMLVYQLYFVFTANSASLAKCSFSSE